MAERQILLGVEEMENEELIDNIINYFLGDTIRQIDYVLYDDEKNPEYSAVTVNNRIKWYIEYNKIYKNDFTETNVKDFFLSSGYDEDSYNKFEIRRNKESEYYEGKQY